MLTEGEYIKPYPIKELGGALGLMSTDIARCLNIRHANVRAKIVARGWLAKACKMLNWNFAAIVVKVHNRVGRPSIAFALDIRAAKAFLAKWDNPLGWAYLNFLFDCERVVEEVIPRLMATLKDRDLRIEALTKPKRIPGPGRRHRVVAGFKTMTDLFGNQAKVPVYRNLSFDQMTDEERRAYEAQHLSKTAAGMSQKAADLINYETSPGRSNIIALPEATNKPKELN